MKNAATDVEQAREVQRLVDGALAMLSDATTEEEVESVRVRFLGKKGIITGRLRDLSAVDPAVRPALGKVLNEARAAVEAAIGKKLEELEAKRAHDLLMRERIDITLPGRKPGLGRKHPLRQTLEEIERIFSEMGFAVVEGPEIEYDEYNFVALNIPKEHPARDMQSSFYVTEDIVLRTQTSPVQIRAMRRAAPEVPLRIIAPGRVFRRDEDATHSPMFHQVEVMCIDRGITMGDLKGTLMRFIREFYGPGVGARFRPSYFPFTEPSAEMDITCTVCGGEGCRTCKGSGFLEILGCGMIHPKVLRNGGYDPEQVAGFAAGMGLERITMLRHGIDDIRLFFSNDMRFLEQF